MRNLNLTGLGLATEVSDRLDLDLNRVRQELSGTLLPRAISVIWSKSPEMEPIRAKFGSEMEQSLINALTHNVITFPGSTGLKRVYEDLISAGFEPAMASAASSALGNYTRFPLSILNLSRHLRTACNFALKVLTLEQQEFSFTLDKALIGRSNYLANKTLKDQNAILSWLQDLEVLMRDFIDFEKTRKSSHVTNAHVSNARENANANLAATYTRRFARYAGILIEVEEIKGYFDNSIDYSLQFELEKMSSYYDNTRSNLFEILKKEYHSRAPRIKSTKTREINNSPETHSSDSTYHEVQLDGKKLKLTIKKGANFDELLKEFVKMIKLQFELGTFSSVLESRMERTGSFLEISLDSPSLSDKNKLIKFVTAIAEIS